MAGTRTFLSTSLSGASGDGNASAERRAIVASFEAADQALEAAEPSGQTLQRTERLLVVGHPSCLRRCL
jgi:hypothetical protein